MPKQARVHFGSEKVFCPILKVTYANEVHGWQTKNAASGKCVFCICRICTKQMQSQEGTYLPSQEIAQSYAGKV